MSSEEFLLLSFPRQGELRLFFSRLAGGPACPGGGRGGGVGLRRDDFTGGRIYSRGQARKPNHFSLYFRVVRIVACFFGSASTCYLPYHLTTEEGARVSHRRVSNALPTRSVPTRPKLFASPGGATSRASYFRVTLAFVCFP